MTPGDSVGIYLTKSIEAVTAFLAVLKAGGFYIPLDSAYSPVKRITGLIRLSGTRFMVTTTGLWRDIAAGVGASDVDSVIFTDTLMDPHAKARPSGLADSCHFWFYDDTLTWDANRTTGQVSMDLAYVLYTSGSTGIPKGVMISHLNALTFVNWARDYFSPGPDDRFANHAPLHFDLSVFDIFVALACGACVHLVPFHIAANPKALAPWIAEKKITYWYSVPQVWISILNYAQIDRSMDQHLTHILFAGEVFPPRYLRRVMEALPQASYYNLYGPTETNVCTAHQVGHAPNGTDKPVPIGKACANTRILVLDDDLKPVDVGQEGELFVWGTTVAAGYYKDPERTADSFIPSPLAEHHGSTFYRTGDLVRRRDEQTYEYLGRKDLMVKCAGFRIELPEVERALYANEAIAEAVVVPAYDHERAVTSLRAFVTPKNEETLSVVRIKQHLGEMLPKYMIPATITQVEALPRNANGKMDRAQVKQWATR
jgi:amino acid adenylation domain-containing protein